MLLSTFIHATYALKSQETSSDYTYLYSDVAALSGLNNSSSYTEDVILTVCHCEFYLDALIHSLYNSIFLEAPNKYLISSSSKL